MKNAPMLLVAMAAVCAMPLVAQQTGASPQAPNSPTTGTPRNATPNGTQPSGDSAVPVPSTANSPEVNNPALRPVKGELESKLDTKNAKAGDSVVVKTTEDATTAGGIVIPKGSKIVGHVTDVEAKGKSGDNSRVTIQFDQAALKGGQNLPIRSVLQSITPAAGDTSGPPSDPNSGTVAGGPAAAGGMNGSGPSTAGTATSSSAGATSGRSGTVSNEPSSGTTSASPGGGGAPAAGTVIARNGNVAIRTTSIPGVLLANNADGQPFANAAGALLGAKQDIHLDSGTHMVLAVVDVVAKNGR